MKVILMAPQAALRGEISRNLAVVVYDLLVRAHKLVGLLSLRLVAFPRHLSPRIALGADEVSCKHVSMSRVRR